MRLIHRTKLELEPLREIAFVDIKSKVTLDNVVDEVFSWVTAGWVSSRCSIPGSEVPSLTRWFRQEKIMEMECDLLISDLKDPKTIGLVKDTIERISDGSSSHCAGALKLGFKKAFELKKQQMGVLLRCTRNGCAKRTNPVRYSSVGSHTYCQDCEYNYGGYYMQCVGCSKNRTGNYTSCQCCGKKFM